jgi:hypothetical protein
LNNSTANVNIPNTTLINGLTDQQSLLNALNCSGSNAVITNPTNTVLAAGGANSPNGNNNVQYYFAMPGNGVQNGSPLQLQNISGIQGLSHNIPIQGLQGLQGLPNLQGAQIVINSNGQPTIFVGNRDC